MRSNVVESRPPENAEIRSSNIPYQSEYRISALDPQHHRAPSSGHKSQENQFRLTPGWGLAGLLAFDLACQYFRISYLLAAPT